MSSSERPRRRPRLPTALLAGVLGVTSLGALPAAADDAAGRPTAIVAMGDSLAAGEGAGDYDEGGPPSGNWCHRSSAAHIPQAMPDGVQQTVNLACSGATTGNVALGGASQYGERPQAEQLRSAARRYDVRSIVLSIGINDVSAVGMAADCALAHLLPGPACARRWDTRLPQRLDVIGPGIVRNLRDIRAVMREAGYDDASYDLVLESYVSPSSGRSRYSDARRVVHGCPFGDEDIAWIHDTAFPMIARELAEAAASVPGVRFLGLTDALDGRQVCAPGIGHDSELTWGVYVDLASLRDGVSPGLVSQSLHPNAAGYRRLAECLRDFHTLPAPSAECEADEEGRMRLTADDDR